jgi:hypothetical protein
MVTAFVIGSVVAGLVSAALLIGILGLLAGEHVHTGGLAVPALVLGLVAGNIATDGLATRAWGPAGRRA